MASRVLIVEDEPDIRGLLAFHLEREGYQVFKSNNGADALRQVRARPPDLVLLDLMLPEMDGHEVFRRLREDPQLGAIPVVFLTARALDTTPVAPGVRYITKPFDTAALIETVRGSIQAAGT